MARTPTELETESRRDREEYLAWQARFIASAPPLTAHQRMVIAAAFRDA